MESAFTVIGTFYDNNQGYVDTVTAQDENDAIEQVQASLVGDERDDDPTYEALRIIAVIAGDVQVLSLANAED